MDKTCQQQGLVPGAAGVPAGRLQRPHAADDRRQLFGAGHLRQQRVLLVGHRAGSSSCCESDQLLGRARRATSSSPPSSWPSRCRSASSSRSRCRARAGVVRLPGADGAAAADPVERRRHHLADLRPRPTSACSAMRLNALGIRLQLHRTIRSTPGSPSSSWTSGTGPSLVALLCYAGLCSIPDAYYQAAKIDGASRWAVFRYIQLPKTASAC